MQHAYWDNLFSFKAPSQFKFSGTGDLFQLSDSEDNVITMSAYNMGDGDLSKFCTSRAEAIHEFYVLTEDPKPYATVNAIAVESKYEGVWPGESKPTFYVVWSIKLAPYFITVTYTTTREKYAMIEPLAIKLVESLKIGT